jgi:hypothetical protein
MFGPKMGSWEVYSEKDPRWNKTGRGRGLATMGGPPGMSKWIVECMQKYGDPPDDATKSFMKD